MGRKKLYENVAERNRVHRAKKKAELEALKAAAGTAPDQAAIREQVKTELKESWEPELKEARIAAERKAGRETARKKDKNFEHGRITGICSVAALMAGKDRADIARFILTHHSIDRETAAGVLEADKRVKSITLESLDKAGAWGKPPPVIK